MISYTYRVPVTTYVICSSSVKKIRSQLTEGINTYRVKIIRLKNWDADQLFEKLFQKRAAGETIGREEFIPVLAAPMMSGTMTVMDRIISGNKLLQDAKGLSKDEIRRESNRGFRQWLQRFSSWSFPVRPPGLQSKISLISARNRLLNT